MSTLHPVAAAIGDIHLEGNIIPHAWYEADVLQSSYVLGKTMRAEDRKPNLVAIILLADIIYWYRPTVIRDEITGKVVERRKKFASDKLQKNYANWGKQFGLSKRQVQEAVTFLKKNGLITVELRTVQINGTLVNNVVYIEPIIDVIRRITLSQKNGTGGTETENGD